PGVLDYAEEGLVALDEAAQGAVLMAGIQRLDGARIYNSAIVLTGGIVPSAIYDKHHLVPFGEYFPLGDLAARFGLHGFAAREGRGFSAGPGPQLVDLPGIGAALPLICYEAVFPQFARMNGDRPDLLVQLTNDAWFGEWSGPFQHLAQARMRAIEQGVPMVRAANTGVSAVIDAQGRVTGQIPLGEAGFLDVALPGATEVPTLYARSGDLPWAALILLAFAALVARRLRGGAQNTD
ncbi:MAG: apolipoprotein N-acyltransferase, partial [Rhodobacteraceae bacterium]